MTDQIEALYDKYTNLKSKNASEIDKLSLDQEQKFKSYVSAADELISYLTSEKDMLSAQIDDLRQEVVSIRSAKDEEQQKYENMLLEETQKNKQLSEEIERLHRKEVDSGDTQSPRSPLSTSNSAKRKRIVIHENEHENAPLSTSNSAKRKRIALHANKNENEVVDIDNIFSGVFNNGATQVHLVCLFLFIFLVEVVLLINMLTKLY
ncbi:uncharacterized protein LOC143586234 [Bidens hawaiensis]|uniref:uncharacterized protein LOC143586234 n=1 Tax=Bidens hawaiensis TaxID=980011 RepID=UPI00404B55B1